jgi:hypothetical protein
MSHQKPVYAKRIGNIRIAVWENLNESKDSPGTRSERKWHSITITKRFRDTHGEWRETGSFTGLGDLAQVALAVRLTQDWLRNREDEQGPQEEAVA